MTIRCNIIDDILNSGRDSADSVEYLFKNNPLECIAKIAAIRLDAKMIPIDFTIGLKVAIDELVDKKFRFLPIKSIVITDNDDNRYVVGIGIDGPYRAVTVIIKNGTLVMQEAAKYAIYPAELKRQLHMDKQLFQFTYIDSGKKRTVHIMATSSPEAVQIFECNHIPFNRDMISIETIEVLQ